MYSLSNEVAIHPPRSELASNWLIPDLRDKQRSGNSQHSGHAFHSVYLHPSFFMRALPMPASFLSKVLRFWLPNTLSIRVLRYDCRTPLFSHT